MGGSLLRMGTAGVRFQVEKRTARWWRLAVCTRRNLAIRFFGPLSDLESHSHSLDMGAGWRSVVYDLS